MPLSLFTGAVATSAEPTLTTDGADLDDLDFPSNALIIVNNPSPGATDSITIRLWGLINDAHDVNEWYPLGTGANTTKGIINEGGAIDSNNGTDDRAGHIEPLFNLRGFRRLYAQVTAYTAGTWDCSLATRDPGNRALGEI